MKALFLGHCKEVLPAGDGSSLPTQGSQPALKGGVPVAQLHACFHEIVTCLIYKMVGYSYLVVSAWQREFTAKKCLSESGTKWIGMFQPHMVKLYLFLC